MDFELLIIEIKKRPDIWDPRGPKHCNRNLMNKNWSELSEVPQLEGIYLKR